MCDINNPNRRVFDVPLSVQRYVWVQKYIESDTDIKSVSDFGCGNGRINSWLKTIPHLEKINFIDVDIFTLEDEMDRFMSPTLFEMLFGRQNTNKNLDIYIYHGDVAIPDNRLSADCFIMVEVIEHMEPEDVERAMRSIFGYYQPKTVIITTPNSEFNHLLRREGEPADKFRHFDHKFEWTRSEFLQWAQQICNRFPYSFHLDGVGHLPNSEPYGPCTQIALFKHLQTSSNCQKNFDCCDLLLNKLHMDERETTNYITTKMPKEISELRSFQLPGLKLDRTPEAEHFDWSTLE